MAQPDPPADLPIKLDPCSNGEFLPPPATPLIRETQRRAREGADAIARRLDWSRRRFLSSLGASALTLLTIDACSREKHASQRRPPPGGSYRVPPQATTEPDAAAQALSDEGQFIMDVQGHLLEYDVSRPGSRDDGGFWRAFPQAGCDAADPRSCFDTEHFLTDVFLQSDTSLVVLSAVPLFGPDNPLSIEVMERTRRTMAALCQGTDRVLLHGQAAPSVGDPARALDGMAKLAAEHPIVAWKTYTHSPAGAGYFLDDHDRSAPQVGAAMLRHAVALKKPIVCVHKGFGGGSRFASPVDIGPAAAANPDVKLVVYHSGYETATTEGSYAPATADQGVNRLISSLKRAGIGAGQNVYAELGSTWRAVMGDPDQGAHVLGKLLRYVGEDNVLWGTDSIWYGSPQDQIQAFRAFAITATFQERYGYPELTPERKAKILGLNAAKLYGVEPKKVSCPFTPQQLQAAREAAPASFPVYGPTTATAVRELQAAHAGWL